MHVSIEQRSNETIKQVESRFSLPGLSPHDVKPGSILLVISCQDMNGLRELWMNYNVNLGKLKKFLLHLFALEDSLVSQDSKTEVQIEIDPEDFYACRRHLQLTCPGDRGFRVVEFGDAHTGASRPQGLSEDYPVYCKPFLYRTACPQLDYLDPAVTIKEKIAVNSSAGPEESPSGMIESSPWTTKSGLKRATSLESLMAMLTIHERTSISHSLLTSLDLGTNITQEDRGFADWVAKQLLITAKKTSHRLKGLEAKREMAKRQLEVQEEMVKSLQREVTRLTQEKDKAQKVLLDNKKEIEDLTGANKGLKETNEELLGEKTKLANKSAMMEQQEKSQKERVQSLQENVTSLTQEKEKVEKVLLDNKKEIEDLTEANNDLKETNAKLLAMQETTHKLAMEEGNGQHKPPEPEQSLETAAQETMAEHVSELQCREDEDVPLTRNCPELVQALIMRHVEPILDNLQARDILTVEECDVIRAFSIPESRACALLNIFKAKEDVYSVPKAYVVLSNFITEISTLCMYCWARKICPIPLACGCSLVCAECMKSCAEKLYCPKHDTETTGLGYNTFVLAVGQKRFEDDAMGFKAIITNPNICGVREENVKLLLNATIENVKDAVAEIATKIRQVRKSQETFFIYYHSGFSSADGSLDFQRKKIPFRRLRDIFKENGATKSLFILDTSHSAAVQVYTMSSSNKEKREQEEQEHPEDNARSQEAQQSEYGYESLPEGSMLWASSRKTEHSGKKDTCKYSVFTNYIIDGLQGGVCGAANCPYCLSFRHQARGMGAVSLNLLRDYVYDHVKNELPQTPSLLGQQEKTYWMAYTQD